VPRKKYVRFDLGLNSQSLRRHSTSYSPKFLQGSKSAKFGLDFGAPSIFNSIFFRGLYAKNPVKGEEEGKGCVMAVRGWTPLLKSYRQRMKCPARTQNKETVILGITRG